MPPGNGREWECLDCRIYRIVMAHEASWSYTLCEEIWLLIMCCVLASVYISEWSHINLSFSSIPFSYNTFSLPTLKT